jgi:ABC-type phosphate transport system permease subunit
MTGIHNRARQKIIDSAVCAMMVISTISIVLSLLFILFYIVNNGIGSLNPDFIFSPENNRGIFPMIVTTFYL